MKTKVICGRSPIIGVGRSQTRINSRNENGGVVVRPSGRRNSLVLAALRLIARKIRDKEQRALTLGPRWPEMAYKALGESLGSIAHQQTTDKGSSVGAKSLQQRRSIYAISSVGAASKTACLGLANLLIKRCRSYGAHVVFFVICYKDVAPTELSLCDLCARALVFVGVLETVRRQYAQQRIDFKRALAAH